MLTRQLGKSGIKTSAMGLGCWAIGGPFHHGDSIVGYGQVNDNESIRAIQLALDMGVTFFDTADAYGCGHSERILGQALAGHRHQAIIATKFGYVPDEATRQIIGIDDTPDYVRRACEASLRRLNTNVIDLYQFHVDDDDYNSEGAGQVRDALEQLVKEGKIRFYGWSTNVEERVRIFAEGEHFAAIQHGLNVLREDPGMIALCETFNLASINRGPLAMGVLTGKFHAQTTFREDDMRHDWGWDFRQGPLAERLQAVEHLREILTSQGRTLAQGALAWIWARSERTIPIPGFKTVAQAQENIGAMKFGPLNNEQMRQIDEILGRKSEQQ